MTEHIERREQAEAQRMNTDALRGALDWHQALAEHYDENMYHSDYHREQRKIKIIRAELARRGLE